MSFRLPRTSPSRSCRLPHQFGAPSAAGLEPSVSRSDSGYIVRGGGAPPLHPPTAHAVPTVSKRWPPPPLAGTQARPLACRGRGTISNLATQFQSRLPFCLVHSKFASKFRHSFPLVNSRKILQKSPLRGPRARLRVLDPPTSFSLLLVSAPSGLSGSQTAHGLVSRCQEPCVPGTANEGRAGG